MAITTPAVLRLHAIHRLQRDCADAIYEALFADELTESEVNEALADFVHCMLRKREIDEDLDEQALRSTTPIPHDPPSKEKCDA